jgi:hypothetical protein
MRAHFYSFQGFFFSNVKSLKYVKYKSAGDFILSSFYGMFTVHFHKNVNNNLQQMHFQYDYIL